ncbi:MAG TPA: CBS domain-containing protein [Streptosporangiaceae bacterium]|nr:CBS domain-containing protein [Streptosporangiaceae bacterium]
MTHTVRDVMTTPVVTVRPDTSFKQVAAMVRAVGTVPVTDDSGLVRGIVCERDLLAKTVYQGRPAGRLAAMRRRGEHKAAAASAASVMTSPAVTTRAGATTSEAARLMYRYRLGSLPVVDWLGRLIGIISQGDVLDSFTREDADIRREVIRDIIARKFLLDPQAFRVTVRDGLVTLSGRPESDQVGRLLAATVRRVEGVVSLRDQMQYSPGSITERALLLPQVPWLSRATAALALAFR